MTPIFRPLIPLAQQRRVIGDRPFGTRRVARIVSGQGLQHQRAILGGPRHRADMVEAEGGRRHAGAADETVSRLDPGDAAQGGRAADRAAGVGADAAEDQPGRDPGTGTAAAAGGEMIGVPRVARRRPRYVEARPAIGEFVGCQFADQHGACGREFLGAGRIRCGHVVREDPRLAGGANAFGIDDVLEPDRDAVKRPVWPASP